MFYGVFLSFSWIFQSYHRRYMAEILPIRRKTLSNQSINQSIQSYHDMITSSLQGLVCSALVVIEQQVFYTWPRLLWQGHFWGLVIYTPVVERLTVPVLWLRSVATGIWTPDLLHARQTLLWTKQQSWPAVISAIYCSFPLINSNPEPIKWYLYKISKVLYRRSGKLLKNARF